MISIEELQNAGKRAAAGGIRILPADSESRIGISLGELTAALKGSSPLVALGTAWAADWHRLGYPTVVMGHKYCAALLSTAPPDFEIRAPWHCFLIRVPDHTLALLNRQGESDPVDRIMCVWYPDSWTYIAIAGRCEFSQVGSTTATLRRGDTEVPHPWAGPFELLPMDSQDMRAAVLIDRLILNACAVLTGDPSQVHSLGKHAPRHHASDGALSAGVYELRRDIRVDCRQAVHDYLHGARHTAPSIRWLVRGHWRQQPYGPEHALRRTQWIEPFWKGAQDAPIAMREHDLRRTQDAERKG